MSVVEPPKQLLVPLKVEERLLMGPGPSNGHQKVLNACAQPILGLLDPRFCEIMDEVKMGLQYVWQTKNKMTFALSGTGHAGVEASIINMTERGEKILICVNGIWGERASDMAERIGCDVRKIERPIGEVFTLEDIKKGIEKHRPSVVFIAHGESSGTTCQPLEGIGELCHNNDCVLIVDTVASLGGSTINVDELEIDVIYSGSQKCLSAPPGLSPISLSPRAWKKLQSRKTKVPSFYFDLTMIANYWGCDDGPRRYHHTGPTNSVYALREALSLVVEEGLENFIARHQKCAELLREGFEKMGFTLFVQDKRHRLSTITGVVIPQGVDWKKVSAFIGEKYKMDISGGLGRSAGKIWRVGLMGLKSTKDNVNLVLKAFKDAMENVKLQNNL
ncbi:serine--pyruvate aminotransferase, mitochondrial-like isoform X2 [Dendronephthya gigantea]|uniref:serine--pyruvate aminotransferase, mitochondrial-like isoform X2 n=1 Tax=Dendronephthya gigantea TaxID=151771 RepID=UPI00106AFF42|nr:serine--pyruvate aminotransferase, mitochondrial-like isoform X2 [Dendronephthya gigantea]